MTTAASDIEETVKAVLFCNGALITQDITSPDKKIQCLQKKL
jgi:hypothetical protein